jgi:hypothetical protein
LQRLVGKLGNQKVFGLIEPEACLVSRLRTASVVPNHEDTGAVERKLTSQSYVIEKTLL